MDGHHNGSNVCPACHNRHIHEHVTQQQTQRKQHRPEHLVNRRAHTRRHNDNMAAALRGILRLCTCRHTRNHRSVPDLLSCRLLPPSHNALVALSASCVDYHCRNRNNMQSVTHNRNHIHLDNRHCSCLRSSKRSAHIPRLQRPEGKSRARDNRE